MERRRFERIAALQVSNTATDTVCDISSSGMSIMTGRKKVTGNVVYLKMNEIVLKAKVVYAAQSREHHRLGLQFVDLQPTIQNKLDEIVDHYSKGSMLNFWIIDDDMVKKALGKTSAKTAG